MAAAAPRGPSTPESEEFVVQAVVAHIRGVLGVLQAIRQTRKQVATVVADKSGLVVYTYDDSKVLQACAHLRKEAFQNYSFKPPLGAARTYFSLSLNNLIDCFTVFAASDGIATLTLKWPSDEGRLLLETQTTKDTSDGRSIDTCTYASIGCEDTLGVEDFENELLDPRSSFTIPCSTLREIVEDLEWAGGPVLITMRRSPKQLLFSASGQVTGSLTLAVDTGLGARSTLDTFICAAPTVSSSYKHKLLKAATSMPQGLMLPADSDAPGVSKVQIDANGVLKVQHLLHVTRSPATAGGGWGGGGGGGGGGGPVPSRDQSVFSSRQDEPVMHVSATIVPVTFVLFPEEEAGGQNDEDMQQQQDDRSAGHVGAGLPDDPMMDDDDNGAGGGGGGSAAFQDAASEGAAAGHWGRQQEAPRGHSGAGGGEGFRQLGPGGGGGHSSGGGGVGGGRRGGPPPPRIPREESYDDAVDDSGEGSQEY